MPQNPESLFTLARPGDLVTWTDARGKVRKGHVAIVNRRDGHLVVNVGGRYGTPVCAPAAALLTVSPRRVTINWNALTIR